MIDMRVLMRRLQPNAMNFGCTSGGKWMERCAARCAQLLLMTAMLAASLTAGAQLPPPALRSYAYVSESATPLLAQVGVTEKTLIEFADRELKARKIGAIDPNRVFEGSEDALRVDIRKRANALVIELSVRQGVSVHNMLERWARTERIALKAGAPASAVSGDEVYAIISAELDALKTAYNTPQYRRGAMLEE